MYVIYDASELGKCNSGQKCKKKSLLKQEKFLVGKKKIRLFENLFCSAKKEVRAAKKEVCVIRIMVYNA